MSILRQINPEELEKNVFQLIGKDWIALTAESGGSANAMTASWGGLGVMWGKDVAFIVVRPQRFTKGLIDNSEMFSLGFLNNSFRKTLNYLGSASGKNEDKIKTSGLTMLHDCGIPYFDESDITVFCKKLYAQDFTPESFVDKALIEKWYPGSDFHTMYIAEITKILVKE